jgi:hypothetical protein
MRTSKRLCSKKRTRVMHEKNCTRGSYWQHVFYSHKGHEQALHRTILRTNHAAT